MPDRRRHRGPHPRDGELFGAPSVAILRRAAADLRCLFDRGYSPRASLALVGDRFQLAARQREAILRATASTAASEARAAKAVPESRLRGLDVAVDGYNVLITVESALAGAPILYGHDGTVRDLASLHGTYRRVEETVPALTAVGSYLERIGANSALWLLDAPVSNSGRLAELIRATAASAGWNWTARVVPDPDPELAESGAVVASSDSGVIDRCRRWIPLSRWVIDACAQPWRIDLAGDPRDEARGGDETSAV